jgi:hypothetical protein
MIDINAFFSNNVQIIKYNCYLSHKKHDIKSIFSKNKKKGKENVL